MASYIIILASALIVLSYLFSIVQKKTHIPSVLMLIIAGYLIKHIASYSLQFTYVIPFNLLKILGTIGLVLIVLEGVLELKITRKDLPIIKRAFFIGSLVAIVSSLIISCILMSFYHNTFFNSLLYAIPLSIVSSAILIPSIHKLSDGTKKTMTYESIFSDIIGIFLFYFLVNNTVFSFKVIPTLAINIIAMLLISLLFSFILIFIISRIDGNARIMLTISILLLVYNLCKIVNLSALLVILVFGIIINNFHYFLKILKVPVFLGNLFDKSGLAIATSELKQLNAEITFFIRTFFFLVFGYSLDMGMLFNNNVILIGTIIVIVIYLIRYMYFKFLHTSVYPEIFMAPRGLITILLFYSIPENSLAGGGDAGVMYFTVIVTIIIMSLSLIIIPKQSPVDKGLGS
ncbi:MAG TPA: hypothetical protein DD381_00845 [Lentisphaeria bacterium]|nr:MAG: hypothetical protein A2X47_00175 [Lentisphaerae bacterium GWF2_38_69]HBM14889.1 hypothetical protein [Lentisphaeria bacterium]